MAEGFRSALYLGHVMHRRFKPRNHRLRYRVFYFLLDLDEIDRLDQSLHLFSRNRFNLFSFHDRDHGDGCGSGLREHVERQLAAAGISFDGGAIRLLAMPRILGYVFNPISIYFCYRRDCEPLATIYEVNNTFGQRHSYVIPASGVIGEIIRQESVKTLHVSPFLGTEMTYNFAVDLPGERLTLSIIASTRDGPQVTAVLAARREGLSDASLLRAFCLYPLLTLKVIFGIHWEALRIWLKGASIHRLPTAPDQPITVGRQRLGRPRRKDDTDNICLKGAPDYVRE